jgi:uncharacterized protein (TIGR03118 family)
MKRGQYTRLLGALVATSIAAACGNDDSSVGSSTTMPPTTEPPTDDNTGGPSKTVVRSDIVSDTGGASSQDAQLINAWGLAFNPAGFAWVSSTGGGVSGVYNGNGEHGIPNVVIPKADCEANPTSLPTGQVFNARSAEQAFAGDSFIFVTARGTIAGWSRPLGETAALRVQSRACQAGYTGVTIANNPANGQPLLFAANFHDGTVDVFDATYAPFQLPEIVVGEGATERPFVDPTLPAGFSPFNVQEVGGRIVVTYALPTPEKNDEVNGPGNGFVNVFNPDGRFIARLVSGGELNSPWGVALAPASFAAAPNRLLIGNFGDGTVHVYAPNPVDQGLAVARYEGPLRNSADGGQPLAIDGLWAIGFGVDAGGFRSDTLYFTAGPDDEKHGIFGRLDSQNLITTPTPPPPPTTPY